MPVKTRKPSRRHRTDARRNRSSVRSRESRAALASVTTRMETPTISAFKRALVRSPETVLRSVYVVPAAKKLRPSFSTLLPPNPQVTINPDAWYRLLARNTDLCYLTLSGQFNPKNGYYLNTGSDSISIAGAFRVLTPKNHFQGRYVVSDGQRITYSPKFADQQTRVIISDAVQLGKRFANNPTAEQYAHLFGENGPASSMDFSFPYGSTFSQAVAYIFNANNIDPKTFSYRSHLDPNIYSKLKNNPNYIPEAQTCKAIFFAIHPTVPLARTLYELAKYHFGNSKDDLILLTFFALFDYDINKYNETMRILGCPQLGIYGVNTWAMSTYESRKSLIANYISPLIGDMKLDDITPRIMDRYYRDLLSVKAVSTKYVKARNEYLTPHTVREIHKVLRNAFNQAVKWELMTRNPVEHATLPKEEHKARDIWTAEVLLKALEACEDDILSLAINLAFSCSLRIGELLGLTWDCVDISPTSIELGQASIFVNKELQRVNREAMADLNDKDIMFRFPPTFASTHTALVLKTPKTKTSVRKVFLPKTVAEMLVKRKADIEELKDLFGDEFKDFNLVFCSTNGKPIEGQVINRAFNKLIEDNGLPKVVFHSLRHSSITYKLKLNGGDMKSVQGDSGHAQVKMVADVYSHIIDDDRRVNAERMEAAFYSGRQVSPEPKIEVATGSQDDNTELLLKLLQNPEMATLLKTLAKSL